MHICLGVPRQMFDAAFRLRAAQFILLIALISCMPHTREHTLPGCLLNTCHSCAQASVSLSVPSFLAPSKLTVNHKWSRPYRCSERGRHRGLVLCEMSLFRLISNQFFGLSTHCVCVCVGARTCAQFIRYRIPPVCFCLHGQQIGRLAVLCSVSPKEAPKPGRIIISTAIFLEIETNHLRRSP